MNVKGIQLEIEHALRSDPHASIRIILDFQFGRSAGRCCSGRRRMIGGEIDRSFFVVIQ